MTPPGRSAGLPDPTRPWYVRVLDSTGCISPEQIYGVVRYPETHISGYSIGSPQAAHVGASAIVTLNVEPVGRANGDLDVVDKVVEVQKEVWKRAR